MVQQTIWSLQNVQKVFVYVFFCKLDAFAKLFESFSNDLKMVVKIGATFRKPIRIMLCKYFAVLC